MKRFKISIATQGKDVAQIFESVAGRVDDLTIDTHYVVMTVEASDDYSANSHVKQLLAERGVTATLVTKRSR